MSNIGLIKPISIQPSMLTSSSIPVDQINPGTVAPAWSSVTTYTAGAYVYLASTNKVYQSLLGSNLNKDPRFEPTYWVVYSATNRWKMFDLSNSAASQATNVITLTLKPGTICTGYGFISTICTSVNLQLVDPVEGTVYNVTKTAASSMVSESFIFDDVYSYSQASAQITITGTGTVSVGSLVVGTNETIGISSMQLGATFGIRDYSRKDTNDFGDVTLIQRAYSKTAEFTFYIDNDFLTKDLSTLVSLRAVPCVWTISTKYDSSKIYGIYTNFDLSIENTKYSKCSIKVEGLT